MRLASVQPGDIVLIGDLHAVVVRKEGRLLLVQGICNHSLRRARGAEVTGHWRRVKAANP
jgi:nitrite reductase/ring-hydroxylating ferredoxin subunit